MEVTWCMICRTLVCREVAEVFVVESGVERLAGVTCSSDVCRSTACLVCRARAVHNDRIAVSLMM